MTKKLHLKIAVERKKKKMEVRRKKRTKVEVK
jgi:hypothetical protein